MDFARCIWFLSISGVLSFYQTQYNISFERMEVVGFDPDYIGWAKTHNFKFNRTNAATILTAYLKVALGIQAKLEVQAYKLASNEYREFPLRFMFDYCQYSANKEFGMDELFACGNPTGCPFKKGIYTSCPWTPNKNSRTKIPSYIPAGSYMLDMKFFYRSVEFLFLQFYGTVKYPECKGC